ncbi:MAG: PEP-CTERM sorting domain-containing protein [Tepidisphaeraceae bacterium]
MNINRAVVFFHSVLIGASSAAFGQAIISINGDSGPWESQHAGINSVFFYGTGDEAPPSIVSSIDGQQIQPGEQIQIAYLNGGVSAGAGWPYLDAAGNPEFAENNSEDNSGNVWPSYYMPSTSYPVYSMELVATFADAGGDIVGMPFPVGMSSIDTVPAGASQLQLGFNDSLYSDNSGSMTVQVSTVPEPSSYVGLLGFGLLLLRHRHTAAAKI